MSKSTLVRISIGEQRIPFKLSPQESHLHVTHFLEFEQSIWIAPIFVAQDNGTK